MSVISSPVCSYLRFLSRMHWVWYAPAARQMLGFSVVIINYDGHSHSHSHIIVMVVTVAVAMMMVMKIRLRGVRITMWSSRCVPASHPSPLPPPAPLQPARADVCRLLPDLADRLSLFPIYLFGRIVNVLTPVPWPI